MTQSALEPARIWGLYAFVSLVFLAVAALLTAIFRRVLHRELIPQWLGKFASTAVFCAIAANLAAIGVDLVNEELLAATPLLYEWSPRLGHVTWLIIWGAWPWFGWVFALPLIGLFLLRSTTQQARVLQTLTNLGTFLAAMPLWVTPWVLWHWYHDQPVVVRAPTLQAPQQGAPRNVMLITFDAWRQRSTSFSYSKHKVFTPHLEALGRESQVFLNARSASDSTMVSLASIFTGLYPPQIFSIPANRVGSHRVDSVPTLVRLLQQVGYRTSYQVAMVDPRHLALAQDFTAPPSPPWWITFNQAAYLPLEALRFWLPNWHRRVENPFLAVYIDDGRKITRRLIDAACVQLSENNVPHFTWLHLPIPHDPYQSFDETVPAKNGNAVAPEQTLETAYENYVRFADRELGYLIQQLKSRNVWQNTLLIVTSDHGEAFLPGHPPGHGHGIPSRDITQVPLLIHVPGQERGKLIVEPVSHVDILPTILDAVSGSIPEYLPGESLLSRPLPINRIVHTWMAPGTLDSTRRVICSTDGTYEYELHTIPQLKEQLFQVVPHSPVNTSSAVLHNQDVLERFRAKVELECPVVWRR